eukprot:975402-Alexandrium_andersonii.AAC.1
MSASLVGSEMCIRDSQVGAEPGLGMHAQGAPRFVLPESHRAEMGREGACLLYTSDAADDM